ncbi:MAG: hypothetical protein JW870_18775, partial [Candidatus Delongbacteria bacterium]|nr:hypothetical protein [Candidatus Delongbacteria bacterium]
SWMKQNEFRYRYPHEPTRTKLSGRRRAKLLHLSDSKIQDEVPQKTMDSFMPKKESTIFDDEFTKADFDLLTKRWKEKYEEE